MNRVLLLLLLAPLACISSRTVGLPDQEQEIADDSDGSEGADEGAEGAGDGAGETGEEDEGEEDEDDALLDLLGGDEDETTGWDDGDLPPPDGTGTWDGDADAGTDDGWGTGDSDQECCDPGSGPGCNDPEIEACVCEQDPFCCQTAWDEQCVLGVDAYQCGVCGNTGVDTGVLDEGTSGTGDMGLPDGVPCQANEMCESGLCYTSMLGTVCQSTCIPDFGGQPPPPGEFASCDDDDDCCTGWCEPSGPGGFGLCTSG